MFTFREHNIKNEQVMKQPSAYVIGNIFFISIGESFNPEIPKKYLKASSSGIYSIAIYTEQEILEKYPDAKPCKDLQSIGDVWKSH